MLGEALRSMDRAPASSPVAVVPSAAPPAPSPVAVVPSAAPPDVTPPRRAEILADSNERSARLARALRAMTNATDARTPTTISRAPEAPSRAPAAPATSGQSFAPMERPPSAESATSPPDSESPPSSRDGEGHEDVDGLFARSKKQLRSNLLEPASRGFRRLAQLDPSAREFALYAAWTDFLMHEDQSGRPDSLDALARVVASALTENEKLAFGHYVRGRVLLLKGEDQRAERAFKTAKTLDPTEIDAERYARLISRRRSAREGT
jgi:hypothetical protein